jgi:transcriptional antiterminator NusG
MARQTANLGRRWYAIHTYAGYEEIVAENMQQRIISFGMQDQIFNILVPTEQKIKIRNGKKKIITEKVFSGYVLVEMLVNDESWYVVRNTPNVTGFISIGNTPMPLSQEEVDNLVNRMKAIDPEYQLDVNEGDQILINDGPFKNMEGSVTHVDNEHGKIKVVVSMFGRETPVELDFLQVKKV